ncbi:LysR family transcriptional regulator [Niallia circulans]|uniref:LysR family transcriptional regulator n=2 Tax=Niallia circulans TaxID=1397 RepID=UPI00203C81AD|nr:LysR family transcriptional regulator [Niallia circulans]
MNLHALRIFITVASAKSVTDAARVLSISQPAVTMQIRNLEKETGLTLIESAGRGIKLTKEGEFLYKQGERLFDLERDIEGKINQLKAGILDNIKIASTYLPANFLLPSLLAKLKIDNPLLHIELYSGNSNEAIEKLLRYKVDLALVVKERWEQPELHVTHIMDVDFWFIVPRKHKFAGKEISFSQLVQEPFLVRENGSSTRDMLYSLCKIHGVNHPPVGLQFHGLNESIHSVIAGYGVMLAPSLAVKEHVLRKEVGVVKVKGVEIKRPIFLCRRNENVELSPLVNQLLHALNNMDYTN